jgi:hypothetical protein
VLIGGQLLPPAKIAYEVIPTKFRNTDLPFRYKCQKITEVTLKEKGEVREFRFLIA